MPDPTRIPAAGSYDLPAEVYHADPAPAPSLSSGVAKTLLAQSPLHAWFKHPRLNPNFEPENKTAFDIGRACHTMLLGKGERIVVVDTDDYRNKDAKADRDAAWAEGLTPLTRPQWEQVQNMHAAALFQLDRLKIGNPFARGESEIAHFAEIDGVWCRCMTDNIDWESRIVNDYKTGQQSAAPGGLARRIEAMGFALSQAHYLDVLAALSAGDWQWRFVFQENDPPHALSVASITIHDVEQDGIVYEAWLTQARRDAARARQIWRMCLDKYGSQPWPGYPAQVVEVGRPFWAEKAQESREEMEADYRRATGKDVLSAALEFQAPIEGAA